MMDRWAGGGQGDPVMGPGGAGRAAIVPGRVLLPLPDPCGVVSSWACLIVPGPAAACGAVVQRTVYKHTGEQSHDHALGGEVVGGRRGI